MKQFEEFWKTYSGNSIYDDKYWEESPFERKFAKDAWKAALEWILYAGVLTDLPKDLIEEELGIQK